MHNLLIDYLATRCVQLSYYCCVPQILIINRSCIEVDWISVFDGFIQFLSRQFHGVVYMCKVRIISKLYFSTRVINGQHIVAFVLLSSVIRIFRNTFIKCPTFDNSKYVVHHAVSQRLNFLIDWFRIVPELLFWSGASRLFTRL